MNFASTRDHDNQATFSGAVFAGLASDGGLFVPILIPKLSLPDISNVLNTPDIHRLGLALLKYFVPEISESDLFQDLTSSINFPVPLIHLQDNIFLLEVFHGPTLAFKDIGARFMARIISRILQHRHLTLDILVATSGDTGSAVAAGFYQVPHVRVHVLYPSGRITHLQEQQMATYGENIFPIEVEGSFDDCQNLVKSILQDRPFAEKNNLFFSTANSINVARLLPQLIYHAWGVVQLHQQHSLNNPVMSVPSGNFGNLVSAIYAHARGIPMNHFIAATNVNMTFPEYLATGQFTARPSQKTFSSAMDVGNPSNFERLENFYQYSAANMRNAISALPINDELTLKTIRDIFETTEYIADPHTAVGIAAAKKYIALKNSTDPVIVTATAHPAKFPEVIKKALGENISLDMPASLQAVIDRPKLSYRMLATIDAFKAKLCADRDANTIFSS